jgi:hypothetical protein
MRLLQVKMGAICLDTFLLLQALISRTFNFAHMRQEALLQDVEDSSRLRMLSFRACIPNYVLANLILMGRDRNFVSTEMIMWLSRHFTNRSRPNP